MWKRENMNLPFGKDFEFQTGGKQAEFLCCRNELNKHDALSISIPVLLLSLAGSNINVVLLFCINKIILKKKKERKKKDFLPLQNFYHIVI